jgi:hypothetical protein
VREEGIAMYVFDEKRRYATDWEEIKGDANLC